MAHDLFGGNSAKNFAIQGHPPIHSFEYVMAGGGYVDRPSYVPRDAWHTHSAGAEKRPQAYTVSDTDLEASQRWISNLSSNIKYAGNARSNRSLSPDELGLWDAFWKKWLVFSGKMAEAQKSLADESLAAKLLAATNPADWPSRTLHKTPGGSLALMSREQKGELDRLLGEAKNLYDRFRLLGLGQVSLPYVGELAALLRSLPAEMSLADMVTCLRGGMKAGTRLLDNRTAWSSWKTTNVQDLKNAIAQANELADKVDEVSKTPPGQGMRDSGTPVYQYVVRILAKIYVAASDLYGAREPSSESTAERPQGTTLSVAWLAAAMGAGYFGWKWLIERTNNTAPKTPDLGYHPQEHQESEKKPWDSTTTD